MSQRPQSGHESTQPDFHPESPNNNQDETQNPSPLTYRPQVSTQDSPPIVHSRRVSIQEPLPISHSRRVSIQDPPPVSSRRVSIQDTPSIFSSRRVSTQDTPSIFNSRRVSTQDTPPLTYSRWVNSQELLPVLQTRRPSVQSPPLITHTTLRSIESSDDSSEVSLPDHRPKTGIWPVIRAKVDIPPSITDSPEASIKSMESITWASQESLKGSTDSSQFNQTTLEKSTLSSPSGHDFEVNSGRFQNKYKRSHSPLPVGWRLLHEAKKISRLLSLALSLAGMVIIGLISLGQPWIHFQVPLLPPWDPAGPLTIPVSTIFFMQCPDSSCLHEYNQDIYFLDFSWAFLIIASITNVCLCIILINMNFFSWSNMPALDFTNIVLSILTGMALRSFPQDPRRGTSTILGVLCYLLQADEFLQEGMTYRLGRSFYLAWTSVFFFMMTGFLSYLNYMNFWSILAIQAVWT
nr:uncharacterized protein LOC106845493 isoform X1 [Equus asinus]